MDKKDDSRQAERVRHPITLWVDKIEFEPAIDYTAPVRTAYDLELTEHDMKILYEGLKKRLEDKIIVPTRIRIIGRLSS